MVSDVFQIPLWYLRNNTADLRSNRASLIDSSEFSLAKSKVIGDAIHNGLVQRDNEYPKEEVIERLWSTAQ